MIERLMSLKHFTYKKPFSGSDKGNRFHYIIRMIEEETETENVDKDSESEGENKPKKIKRFSVVCWEGEGNSKVTPDEQKQFRKFDFSEEGYEELLKWLNEESDKIV